MRLTTSILWPVMAGVCIFIMAQNTVQVQGLRCMDCTNAVLDGSSAGILVNPILNFIPGIRDKNCMDPKSLSDIDMITCPPNPDSGDRVYRCGAYTGTINVVMAGGISNGSIKVIDRQCVLIYQGLDYVCHPQTYVQDDASDFQKIFDSLKNLGVVDFDGQICLYNDIDATKSSSICSSTSRRSVHSLVLLMAAYFLCILSKLL